MSRTIKFRAWDLKASKWHEGWGSLFPWGSPVGDNQHVVIGIMPEYFVFQQFTGLLDRNGKEIYEGDIVRFSVENADRWVGATKGYIEYDDGEVGFVIVDAKKNIITISRGYDAYSGSLEIIGNIYENPHLLEKKP